MAFLSIDGTKCLEEGVRFHAIVGPANQNGCIILCVGNLVDEKF
jgi:hypothetical protein